MKKTTKIQKTICLCGGDCCGNSEKSVSFNNRAHNAQIQANLQTTLSNIGSGGPQPQDSWVCSGDVCCAWNVNNGYAEIFCWGGAGLLLHKFYKV